jgi:hypothetical protein
MTIDVQIWQVVASNSSLDVIFTVRPFGCCRMNHLAYDAVGLHSFLILTLNSSLVWTASARLDSRMTLALLGGKRPQS